MDANATTPLLPEVFEVMRPFLMEQFGNASSVHQQGQRARGAVERARMQVAKLLGASAAEIVFTSGGTESDNLALFGTLEPGDHLVTSTIEHHAMLHAAEELERRGVDVTFVGCDCNGVVQPEALRAAMRPDTRMVSIMFANNETGAIQPIVELAKIAKAHGALFATDAVQGAGKLKIDLAGELKDVDLLAVSGHKIYGPQGTGVLFVRKGVELRPLFHGGTHERQRRAGTENVAGIAALGKAAEMAGEWLVLGSAELQVLRDRLEQKLLAEVPECGVNGSETSRTPNTSNVWFEGADAESLVITLDLNGLSVSGGSACQSGAAEPSHVLMAMGLETTRAKASVRISLSRTTTADEVDRAVDLIAAAVKQGREFAAKRRQRDSVQMFIVSEV